MSKINKKSMTKGGRMSTKRLAGGAGQRAAKQDAEALLRRAVMACLLWEDLAYETGEDVSNNIASLIPQVEPDAVENICIEAREKQKLRHAPLFIAREMARHPNHNEKLWSLLPRIITRVDMLTDFLAIYWKDKKQPLTNQVKKGLANSFYNFDEYQFAKYNRKGPIKLRDVMFLVHPKPKNKEQERLFKAIAEDTLQTPDTWEVALSKGDDKKKSWTRLIETKKLGALAFLRNLRNMEQDGVDRSVVKKGLQHINSPYLLPLNFLAAYKNTTHFADEVEKAMFRCYANRPKLKGHTVFVIDVSGSMGAGISAKSKFTRHDAANAMAILARECAEDITLYITAGSDGSRKHKTMRLQNVRGFQLIDKIEQSRVKVGWGGIFTRQCLEWIKKDLKGEYVDRIIVFSDSQDCDTYNCSPAKPFGDRNYIIDVSAHKHGINYKNTWDAEISGWSEHFIDFIQAYEEGQ